MIKPASVCHLGAILDRIQEEGFEIIALKMIKIEEEKAKIFYDIHKEKSFFDEIIYAITKNQVIVMILEKQNAVLDFRNLIGDKDPTNAANGTIRKEYGFSLNDNAIHGSDCEENAKREISLFFDEKEIFI